VLPSLSLIIPQGKDSFGKEAIMKRPYFKAVAVVLCFAFVLMTVPSLRAEKKAAKIDFRLLIKQPRLLISYLLPFLGDNGTKASISKVPSFSKVKPTGDSPSPRPGTQD
jgi:hypothetical protein